MIIIYLPYHHICVPCSHPDHHHLVYESQHQQECRVGRQADSTTKALEFGHDIEHGRMTTT